jgi:hypothetical protein
LGTVEFDALIYVDAMPLVIITELYAPGFWTDNTEKNIARAAEELADDEITRITPSGN